jgi:hypothetical protein
LRHRIIAARILRLDRGRADNYFRAQRFQEVDFFLGLFVGDGENHLVAANGGDQSEPHSSVSRSAFDDRAAWLQQTFLFGFVDHGDADAVFHRAAGIDVVGFHIDLRLQALVNAIEPHQRGASDSVEDVVTFHLIFPRSVYFLTARAWFVIVATGTTVPVFSLVLRESGRPGFAPWLCHNS